MSKNGRATFVLGSACVVIEIWHPLDSLLRDLALRNIHSELAKAGQSFTPRVLEDTLRGLKVQKSGGFAFTVCGQVDISHKDKKSTLFF
jgi:hypothetical protein